MKYTFLQFNPAPKQNDLGNINRRTPDYFLWDRRGRWPSFLSYLKNHYLFIHWIFLFQIGATKSPIKRQLYIIVINSKASHLTYISLYNDNQHKYRHGYKNNMNWPGYAQAGVKYIVISSDIINTILKRRFTEREWEIEVNLLVIKFIQIFLFELQFKFLSANTFNRYAIY